MAVATHLWLDMTIVEFRYHKYGNVMLGLVEHVVGGRQKVDGPSELYASLFEHFTLGAFDPCFSIL